METMIHRGLDNLVRLIILSASSASQRRYYLKRRVLTINYA